MILVLADLEPGTRPIRVEAPADDDRQPLDGPASLDGELEVGHRIELRGRVAGRLRLECGRCLEPFVLPVDVPFDLRLVGEHAESGPGEAEMRLEDASLVQATAGRVDLGRVALELLDLELPLKPICEPGCRGLCPACGENRNRIECGCPRESIDPRLAPLLDLQNRSRR